MSLLFSTLVFSGQDWLYIAVAGLFVALLLLGWNYRRAPASSALRWSCAILKLLGIAALLTCLLEPLWSGQRAKPGANLCAIVADNSQGLLVTDPGQTKSRAQLLQEQLLGERSGWQDALEKNFTLRRYVFDSRLQPTPDFAGLRFDGMSSALMGSLQTLGQRLQGRPAAGIILFTDGNATDFVGELPNLDGLPPIYAVVAGSDEPIRDLAVQKITVTQTAFEDAPVSIQADVAATGFENGRVQVKLVRLPDDPAQTESEEESEPAAEQEQAVDSNNALLAYRFQVKPSRSGLSYYRLLVSSDQPGAEGTMANNNRIVVVDRGRGPYRILYVAGRPNWEYKYLSRAALEDDQLQLVGLIRVARREPKFEFRGRAGETSNPLFRGFDRKTEDTERYDQPVLKRINPRDELELSAGFPKTPEELFRYHAIIIDDLEAEFFTAEQNLLVQKFVSQRGGGFLMLGGMESFRQGNYSRTPIGEMLPVYLDGQPQMEPPGDLRLALTKEGGLQPWLRLRSTEEEERARFQKLPHPGVLNIVSAIKPGATVMAQVTDGRGQTHPALVVQRFGFGRAAALTVGDMWRSGNEDPSLQEDLGKTWRQMLRWLVADVPVSVELTSRQIRSEANQPVRLEVRVRDPKFEALENAAVMIAVEPVAQADNANGSDNSASTNRIQLEAEPSATEPGLYEATYIPRMTGGFRAEATATNTAGAEIGRAEAGWVSDLAAEEFRALKPNRSLVELLAKRTGGKVVAAGDLDKLARDLPQEKVPITETWTFPIWHHSAVFLFALLCFVSEWGLRRYRGLA